MHTNNRSRRGRNNKTKNHTSNSRPEQRSKHGGSNSSRGNSNSRNGYSSKPQRRNNHSGRNQYQRSNNGRSRSRAKSTISHDRYIAKAVEGEISSIYVTTTTFDDFKLDPTLKGNIRRKGYINPTKIQDQAIPHLLEGRDVLGQAKTGSGKTAAFLLPMINKAMKDRTQKCLIVLPARELAMQILEEFKWAARGTNVYATLIIGGASIYRQEKELRRSPQFVIGTPGRIKDMSERRILDLSHFNNVVLDEVDRMLDMGFIHDIKLIVSKLREQKQSKFFSATLTKETENIANSLLKNPVRIQVESQQAVRNVDQDIVHVKSPEHKLEVLHDLLNKEELKKVLIFARTRRGSDKLSTKLHKRGFKVDSIHGDKTQNRRIRAINKFRDNQIDILVATDVVARGIDIQNISHVINYDVPATWDDYIHRIGRTGRIGKKGTALTFVN